MHPEDKPVRKGRGKGKKPAMAHVNLRIPDWVLDFYKQQPNYSKSMRSVLMMYALENRKRE